MPEPPFRPGDTPDFSSLKIPAAGKAPRPDVAAPAAETHPLTTDLVRVLGDDDKPVGPWDQKLDPDTLRKMLRDMVTVRIFDDRMYRSQRQGKTSFYMKCTGEEAIAVAAQAALDREDMHFPTYRQQGLLIARGYPLTEMMNQIYSNKGDKLQGRQLPIMPGLHPLGESVTRAPVAVASDRTPWPLPPARSLALSPLAVLLASFPAS